MNRFTNLRRLWALLLLLPLLTMGSTAALAAPLSVASPSTEADQVTMDGPEADWGYVVCEQTIIQYFQLTPAPGPEDQVTLYVNQAADGAGDGTIMSDPNALWLEPDGFGWFAMGGLADTFGNLDGGPWSVQFEVNGSRSNLEWLNFECNTDGPIESAAAWDDVSCDVADVTGRIVPPILAEDLLVTVNDQSGTVTVDYQPTNGELALDRQDLLEQVVDDSVAVNLSRQSTGQSLGAHVYSAEELSCPVENLPPEPKNQTVEVDLSEDSKEFTLEATDPEGDVLTFVVNDEPTNGTLEQVGDEYSPHFVFYPETRGESVVDWSVSDGINDPQFAEVTFQVTETITPPEPSFDPETGLLTLPAVDGLVYHVDGEPRQDPYQVCGTSVVEVFGADQWVELNGTTSWTYAYECDAPDPDPTWGGDTSRIGGVDRYHTANMFGQWWGQQGSTCVAIAQGRQAPDASVGGGMLAARSGMMSAAAASCDSTVVLLARGDSLPSATVAALNYIQPPAITVLGGEGAVSEQVRLRLLDYTTADDVTRIGGSDRYATAAAMARVAVSGGMSTSTVFLANGEGDDLANALSAAALKQYPVLLVRGDSLPRATAEALAEFNPTKIVVVGNTDSVSEEVAQAAGATARVDGASHEEVSVNLMLTYLDSAGGVFVVRDDLYPDGLATSALSGPVVTVRGDVASDLLIQSLDDMNTATAVIAGGSNAVSIEFQESLENASRRD